MIRSCIAVHLLILIGLLSATVNAFFPSTFKRFSVPISLSNLNVKIDYIWGVAQKDLDTSTIFLTDNVGYSCGDNPSYSTFSGDNTGSSGNENVLIDVAKAVKDNAITSKVSIKLHAGWYSGQAAAGIAQVRVSLIDVTTKKTVDELTIGINPAESISGCARQFVARVQLEQRPSALYFELTNIRAPITKRGVTDGIYSASVIGDPHIFTFDGLRYDCQAVGKFVLAKDIVNDMLDLQARFKASGPSPAQRKVTYMDGVVINYSGTGKTQVSIALNPETNSTMINGCPIVLFDNGNIRDLRRGTGTPRVNAIIKRGINRQWKIVVSYPQTSFSLSIYPGRSSGKCAIEAINLQIPQSLTNYMSTIGLLGNPTGNHFDDWKDDQYSVSYPPNSSFARLYKRAYDFCNSWCIDDGDGDLFTLEEGEESSTCGAVFPGQVNIRNPSVQLRNICKGDKQCLVDGVNNGVSSARTFKLLQTYLSGMNGKISPFQFRPSSVKAGRKISVLVTLNLRDRFDIALLDITKFALFNFNVERGVRSSFVVDMTDDGNSANGDLQPRDGIFSAKISVVARAGAQPYSYQAVPVLRGQRLFNSPLAHIRVDAVGVTM